MASKIWVKKYFDWALCLPRY